MATKTAALNMRIESKKKAEAEALYNALGLTLPQAVNMFISQSLIVGGIPFDVRLPGYNRETEEAFQEARDIASGKIKTRSYSSTEELFNDLDRE
ncbi:MAG: type II toxin-antitoxin system RelB/DinJ family antitoxin [Firmicutes bacterium]|nr:type II toxin-antitoxin system RelB/DinJ family antitoxin [Bacillota bacterium]MBQ6013258.1 type II toxin-antitoxin system RelB/DinJ family antitoxin [Bacillota bacterium]MBQ6259751.1 type II toxin-antitoxin system RelB/DinJ family antitoxin [Bacillota bacterium]MBR0114746.1 type II toxin-antitoxin system RelB/DinJ family antitoxin [Bacillota bacterium]MBR0523147.1 type II toxin-antitoxin system RelB/DinJ family antitoxin [Bacillota bacterium]